MSKLVWIEKPVRRLYGQLSADAAHYQADFSEGKPPYLIRKRITKGKTFFIVSCGLQHYATVRSLERAQVIAEADYVARKGRMA